MLGELSANMSMASGITGSTKKQSETESQLESFSVAIMNLGKEIVELESALNPVLRGQDDEKEESDTPQPTLTPLANKLREMKNSVIISAEKIREIRNRLEI